MFFSSEIQRVITNNSNLYGLKTFKRRKNVNEFKAITLEDIRNFFSIIYAMGITRYPELSLHWKRDGLYNSEFIRSVMSRDAFDHIKKALHISDPHCEDSSPYSKLEPFYSMLQNQCRKIYLPDQFLSLDESMIKYKGRHKNKQYMPRKPTKWGFKCFAVAEASTGYISNFHIYEGANEDGKEFTKNIVLNLMEIFRGQNYYVFMDNYYSSVLLFQNLLEIGIYATGTIRKTRKYLPA
jgi:hypothetical protein